MSIFCHFTFWPWNRTLLPLGLLVLPVLLGPAYGDAAIVTRRLSTGWTATTGADDLPQAWIVPADASPAIDGQLGEPARSKSRPVWLGKLDPPVA